MCLKHSSKLRLQCKFALPSKNPSWHTSLSQKLSEDDRHATLSPFLLADTESLRKESTLLASCCHLLFYSSIMLAYCGFYSFLCWYDALKQNVRKYCSTVIWMFQLFIVLRKVMQLQHIYSLIFRYWPAFLLVLISHMGNNCSFNCLQSNFIYGLVQKHDCGLHN